MERITIIGGGVNGLCSAYYLNELGYEVTVIDKHFSPDGTSYGNAGMIVPSHFIPMASPGVISKGLRWMFDSSSPFYIRPRLDLRLIQWLWRFRSSCNANNVEKSQELIWKYNELSKAEYKNISKATGMSFDLHTKGLLMLYQSDKARKEELEVAEKATELGLQVQELDQSGVQKLNPDTEVNVLGGVYYPDDGHLYSNLFMERLQLYLRSKGVQFIISEVKDFELSDKIIHSVELKGGARFSSDQFILTAGTWTWKLMDKLGLKLLLEDGKGYSITRKDMERKPTIPSILTSEKVAITPMLNDLRITGTLEISGISKKINRKRVASFLSAVPRYFPELKLNTNFKNHEIWTGYRPLSFDGVPYVGRSGEMDNLVVATGHGMMGMSMGPGTGKLVSQIIAGTTPSLDLELMRIER